MLNSNKNMSLVSNSDPNIAKKSDFVALSLDTDSFGEYWTNYPIDEKSYDYVSKYINTPEKYFEAIKNNGNFHPVHIINDEANASAKFRNKIVLIHATISGFNINILVKSYDGGQTDLVANFLREII